VRSHLLIIDDDPTSRARLGQPFRRRGIDIVEADDGAAALRLIDRTRFDAVILDISAPGAAGLGLLKAIRARHSQSSLPVILVTGRIDTDDIMIAFRLGANDYVRKPVDVPVLVARVLAQVSRRHAEERLEQALSQLARINIELHEETRRRAHSEAQAWDLAHHDPLTGVRNRLRFWKDLEAEIECAYESRPLALLCLDLDGFKAVNDTLGHQVGDDLLRAVAERIRGCLEDGVSVARLGGDEFAVLLPCVESPQEPQQLAQRIIDVITMPVYVDGHEVGVGCSVGIAVASSAATEPEILMRQADTALYAAKAGGRGRWCVFAAESSGAAAAQGAAALAPAPHSRSQVQRFSGPSTPSTSTRPTSRKVS
jgi:diguanylate cyclase (GGDEF)-like protein